MLYAGIKNTAGMRSTIMVSLNNHIREYTHQLRHGQIQIAYKGVMTFMSGLSRYLEGRHPNHVASALYPGYMDMTYFAFSPPDLKNKKLKIAIVYLHEEGRFEAWLGGINRRVQSEYIDLLSGKNIGPYILSQAIPGVDSIIESILVEQPDFDHQEELMMLIESKYLDFVNNIATIL
jgi:hypothetical protein